MGRFDLNLATDQGIGAVNGTGVTVEEKRGQIQNSVINLASTSITVTDTGGANGGYGSLKIYDLPAGNILVLGATSNLSFTRGSTGISATAVVKHALGSVAVSTSDTLSSTLANVIPSTNATLAAGTGSGGGESTAVTFLDGTTTAADLILNIGVADANISASDSVSVSGTVNVSWINLGDN